jgi:hypothetical protein
MIEENIRYKDILDWWLYEDVEKNIYYKSDYLEDGIISVKTLEELYDYMIKNNN